MLAETLWPGSGRDRKLGLEADMKGPSLKVWTERLNKQHCTDNSHLELTFSGLLSLFEAPLLLHVNQLGQP